MDGSGTASGGTAGRGLVWTIALALVAVPAGALATGRLDLIGAALLFAFASLLEILPVLLLGVVLTAGIAASGSTALIAAAFEGRQARMILLASLAGALTPVCGASVLPLVAGLLAARVPLAPIMAFWLSSPVTDPGMLAVTAATLGWPFALAKTGAAFGVGLLGGGVTLLITRSGRLQAPARGGGAVARMAERACGACAADGSVAWRFWREPARRRLFGRTAWDSARLILVWLSLAFLAEFFLQRHLPAEAVAGLVGGDSPWAVPVATLVGAPIYLDGYAALPLVRGLIEAGMGQGAAMAFLVSGGVISAWAAIPVFALVRTPVFLCYVGLALAGALLAGWGSGLLLG